MDSRLLLLYALFPLLVKFTSATVEHVETVGFVKEDNSRDTTSLIISCLATLGLCVYSAVHLNVPPKRERFLGSLWREVKWCIIGLFGPELVLYTAWRQWASARELSDEVKRTMGNQEIEGISRKPTANGGGVSRTSTGMEKGMSVSESEIPSRSAGRYPWTMTHGFYATMGGFAIDLEDTDSEYASLFGDAKRLTLTAKGVALLAQVGHLPDLSMDDIKDKNKTDSLAKFLVCVQAGWMVVQVISRRAFDLPTTLLEVHTVAHVVCAILMYVLWWYKPRHVEYPTLLRGDWVWPLAAYMYSASRISGQPPRGTLGRFLHPKPELRLLAYFEEPETETSSDDIAPIHRSETDTTLPITRSPKGRFARRPGTLTSDLSLDTESPPSSSSTHSLRLRLAEEAVSMYPALRSKFQPYHPKSTANPFPPYYLPYATELVQHSSLDWPSAGLLRRTQSQIMGMVLWGASMAYGAIHVSAWDYFFPSAVEKLLWRLSSVWVTFCAAWWLMTNLLAHLLPAIDQFWNAFNERRLGPFWTGLVVGLCTVCGVSYVASRMFLVVEAFVSIREVPVRVYDTPSWSQVFPHL
ncbi:uncharacterized protein BDR25DRAFT_377739 [Lindgomyces ingoldianus]|uniref:Uncharacterized protein n=1 Tax=Lindgomyces ingoldianus TaxID=673940 RepID=A0ACB6QIA9_9PLEO|nr:uncharacterized protein BDR25DRAFT_377739 [Lindgomyces ingoldianus]KAF2466062.1 hypothetical protein BDR25DRAFT_377739 [Lindgomyces ingoldianus]